MSTPEEIVQEHGLIFRIVTELRKEHPDATNELMAELLELHTMALPKSEQELILREMEVYMSLDALRRARGTT